MTFDRLSNLFEPDEVFIVTSRDHVDLTEKELPEVPPGNIIGEPVRRNTAAACYLGGLAAGLENIQLVLPADHLIENLECFHEAVREAACRTEEKVCLSTFGIVPHRPETGYGYIEIEGAPGDFTKALSFREKPDPKSAEAFLQRGNFLWNSGMFIWRGKTLEEELRKQAPDVHGPLEGVDPRDPEDIEKRYKLIRNISIDHAVMERSDNVWVKPVDLGWSDLGSWLSIMEVEGPTVDSSNIVLVDSKDVLVRSGRKRPVAVVGLDGIIVVDTKNGLLVCSKEKAQQVRSVPERLRKGSG